MISACECEADETHKRKSEFRFTFLISLFLHETPRPKTFGVHMKIITAEYACVGCFYRSREAVEVNLQAGSECLDAVRTVS